MANKNSDIIDYILFGIVIFLILFLLYKNAHLRSNEHLDKNSLKPKVVYNNLVDSESLLSDMSIYSNNSDCSYNSYYLEGDVIKTNNKCSPSRLYNKQNVRFENNDNISEEISFVLNDKKYGNWDDIVEMHNRRPRGSYSHGGYFGENNSNCPVFGVQNDVDKYIKDIALGGKFLCDEKPKVEYTRKDITQNQDNFFDFNDNINRSSDMHVDPVDKMNMMKYSGGAELNNIAGKKLGDVIDTITKTRNEHRNIPLQPVIYEKENDTLGYQNIAQGNFNNLVANSPKFGNSQALDNDYLLVNTLKNNVNFRLYDDDNVSNGGKFFSSVEGKSEDYMNTEHIN
jgi:hypothetical protein